MNAFIQRSADERRAGTPRQWERVSIGDISVDAVTEEEAVRHVVELCRSAQGGWVTTPNVDHLRLYRKHQDLRQLGAMADLVVADGMPLVWASHLQRTPLPERVAGSNLIWSLSAAAANAGIPVFLLGGDEGVAARAADELRRALPTLQVAGTYCPPHGFERSERELEGIRNAIKVARPGIVYVALGFPKQERLIQQLRGDYPHAWYLGVGISFSFVSGDVRRAPEWMHDAGLEWMHRLVVDPRRLWSRYLRHGIPFVTRLLFVSSLRGLMSWSATWRARPRE